LVKFPSISPGSVSKRAPLSPRWIPPFKARFIEVIQTNDQAIIAADTNSHPDANPLAKTTLPIKGGRFNTENPTMAGLGISFYFKAKSCSFLMSENRFAHYSS
jgi:hypothetical protein